MGNKGFMSAFAEILAAYANGDIITFQIVPDGTKICIDVAYRIQKEDVFCGWDERLTFPLPLTIE